MSEERERSGVAPLLIDARREGNRNAIETVLSACTECYGLLRVREHQREACGVRARCARPVVCNALALLTAIVKTVA
jgi:hypothetical protein